MSVAKGCEVCGGRVRPANEESEFGYCEKCGIVYLMKIKSGEESIRGALEVLEGGVGGGLETKSREPSETGPVSQEEAPSAGHRWRCPDCGMAVESPDEGDLEFIKREHFREYHPNRAAG